MYLRQEKPEDYEAIYVLVKAAFETAEIKGGDEQDYVIELRKSSRYIPELALVAAEKYEEKKQANAEQENIIGHIMLTQTELVSRDKYYDTLLLSPLCVALSCRKRGIGGALIKESFRLAGERGYSAVFLCGDPEYYMKYGFRKALEFGIINERDPDPEHVMAYELFPNALKGKSGTINIL